MTFKYFAYGSNMLLERLRRRCPSAKTIGVSTLNGYTLEFSKPSKDGSGKATIVKSEATGARVVGVIFEVGTSELEELDHAEGYGNGYERNSSLLVKKLTDGTPTITTSYFATKFDRCLKPYDWYWALVMAGATQQGLPRDWIAMLEAVEFVHDPELGRDERVRAIKTLRETGYENLLEAVSWMSGRRSVNRGMEC
jgi:gamma-glutamylcyclotransferase